MNSRHVMILITALSVLALSVVVVTVATPYWLKLDRQVLTIIIHVNAGLWQVCLSSPGGDSSSSCEPVAEYWNDIKKSGDKSNIALNTVRVAMVATGLVGLQNVITCFLIIFAIHKRSSFGVILMRIAIVTSSLAGFFLLIALVLFGLEASKIHDTHLSWSYYCVIAGDFIYLTLAICLVLRRRIVTQMEYTLLN